jgi:hypothetical protein
VESWLGHGGVLLAACLLALPPFEGFGFVYPGDVGGVEAGEDVADLSGRARKNISCPAPGNCVAIGIDTGRNGYAGSLIDTATGKHG